MKYRWLKRLSEHKFGLFFAYPDAGMGANRTVAYSAVQALSPVLADMPIGDVRELLHNRPKKKQAECPQYH